MTGSARDAYWDSVWPGEDAGASRTQIPRREVDLDLNWEIRVTSRPVAVATMVVLREPGEMFLLCHNGGDDAVSWVERIDPVTLECVGRSADLPGGPTWPGGIAAHANGSLYVVFGRHAHRLDADLNLTASRELPRNRPYNSFVLTSDGVLITKDFGGARPGEDPTWRSVDTEVLALDPDDLAVLSSVVVPEASIARVSALDDDVYVVGDSALHRLRWSPVTRELEADRDFVVRYRGEGEGFGWDCVLCDDSAWFLNNGQGSERFNGALRGLGMATAAQDIVRIDLSTRLVTRYEVHPGPGGIVANPPVVDAQRGVVIGYDSGNAEVVAHAYREDPPRQLWRRELNHGAHPILLANLGIVVLCDFDVEHSSEAVVLIDVLTGLERARVVTPSPVQSVLFGAVGFEHDLYLCSFLSVSRISFGS